MWFEALARQIHRQCERKPYKLKTTDLCGFTLDSLARHRKMKVIMALYLKRPIEKVEKEMAFGFVNGVSKLHYSQTQQALDILVKTNYSLIKSRSCQFAKRQAWCAFAKPMVFKWQATCRLLYGKVISEQTLKKPLLKNMRSALHSLVFSGYPQRDIARFRRLLNVRTCFELWESKHYSTAMQTEANCRIGL